MITTIDKAGRVVIPAQMRKRLGLTAGTELELTIDGGSLRLARAVDGPELTRRGNRWVVRRQSTLADGAEVDAAALVEEERARWPS